VQAETSSLISAGHGSAVDVASPRIQRRNVVALMGDYVLFGMALNILNPTAMPPDFVAQLGGGPILVGVAGLLWRVTWLLPQLAVASVVNRAPRKKKFMVLPSLARLGLFGTALLMALAGPEQPGLLILALLGGMVVLALGDGSSVVAWTDVLGSSLQNEARSQLIVVSQVLSSVLVALLISPLIRVVLGPQGPAFPNNYALLLAIAAGLLAVGLIFLSRTVEGHSPPPQDSPDLRQYARFLGRILREDKVFRTYILMRFVYDLAAIGVPFYIVFSTTQLGLESAVALSDQILLLTLAGIVSALVFGRLNARTGPRSVIVVAALSALLTPLLILSSSWVGVIGFHLLWIVQAFLNGAFVPGFLNFVVEYAPEGYRPIYGGLSNTFGALALLAPILGGVIVQQFSYQALFVVGAVLGGIALLLALRLPEPRRLRTSPRPAPHVERENQTAA
jgi:MFS family permease